MKLTCTQDHAPEKHYAPLPLGNGDISLLIDYTGNTVPKFYSNNAIQTGIWRAGYRLDNATSDLVSFGWFEHILPDSGPVTAWTQTLHLDPAASESSCTYTNGVTVETFAYCLLHKNLIVIRKQVIGANQFAMRYHFAPRRTTTVPVDSMRTAYEIDTWNTPRGIVAFFSKDDGITVTRTRDDITINTSSDFGVFYLALDEEAAFYAQTHSDADIAADHRAAWQAFWRESTLPVDSLPQQVLQAARTSEYHLRISSTKWSIPTGIYPTHWQGRYFAFDEFFCLQGLLASGHYDLACKIPRFRASQLETAINRAYRYFSEKRSGAARFVWETVEQPGREGAPGGFWLEHIFHHAHIALGSWLCYRYRHDEDFLRDIAYSLMRSCAEYYRIFCVYEKEPGHFVIGKCTDLERLGAARENPFMTSCSAIATFRAAAQAAKILNTDDDLQQLWQAMDTSLTASLPQNDHAYIPYPGCTDKSIALLSGIFPYGNLSPDDAKSRHGIDDFCATESQFGNMYPVGKSLCTWYAGWKAMTFIRLGELDIAKSVIQTMASETGNFSDVFEILETGHHPWFTTGEGVLLQAICEAYKAPMN